jgi:hypothetical protein
MYLQYFVTAVALATFVGTQFVARSPAIARGAAGGFSPGTGAYIPLPPQLEPWQQVKQVPIFGGQDTFGQAAQSTAAPQSAQAPGEDAFNASSTLVAPGVARNPSGQIERSP